MADSRPSATQTDHGAYLTECIRTVRNNEDGTTKDVTTSATRAVSYQKIIATAPTERPQQLLPFTRGSKTPPHVKVTAIAAVVPPVPMDVAVATNEVDEDDDEYGDDALTAGSKRKRATAGFQWTTDKRSKTNDASSIADEELATFMLSLLYASCEDADFVNRTIDDLDSRMRDTWFKIAADKNRATFKRLLHVVEPGKGVTGELQAGLAADAITGYLSHIPAFIRKIHESTATSIGMDAHTLDEQFANLKQYDDKSKRHAIAWADFRGVPRLVGKSTKQTTYMIGKHVVNVRARGDINASTVLATFQQDTGPYVKTLVVNTKAAALSTRVDPDGTDIPVLFVNKSRSDREVQWRCIAPMKIKVPTCWLTTTSLRAKATRPPAADRPINFARRC